MPSADYGKPTGTTLALPLAVSHATGHSPPGSGTASASASAIATGSASATGPGGEFPPPAPCPAIVSERNIKLNCPCQCNASDFVSSEYFDHCQWLDDELADSLSGRLPVPVSLRLNCCQ